MTEQQFTYWLQGFAELTGENPPTAEQWKSIREHLQTVFQKVTPSLQVSSQPYQPNNDGWTARQQYLQAGQMQSIC